MESLSKKNNKEGEKVHFFEVIVEVYAWLEVVFASAFVGCIIGLITYYSKPDKTRLYIGIAIVILSLVIGIYLAITASNRRQSARKDSKVVKEEQALPK